MAAGAAAENPVFYVSSSAWNVYELFVSLLDQHEIPRGPLLLRNLGLDRRRGLGVSHIDHKFDQIRPIFETYPELPFVLVGDSGQKDPEIYRQVIDAFPGRVRAVYIRDVTSPERDAEVHTIAGDLEAHGVPVVLAEDSVEVARHAAELGLISPSAVELVSADCERDIVAPSGGAGLCSIVSQRHPSSKPFTIAYRLSPVCYRLRYTPCCLNQCSPRPGHICFPGPNHCEVCNAKDNTRPEHSVPLAPPAWRGPEPRALEHAHRRLRYEP